MNQMEVNELKELLDERFVGCKGTMQKIETKLQEDKVEILAEVRAIRILLQGNGKAGLVQAVAIMQERQKSIEEWRSQFKKLFVGVAIVCVASLIISCSSLVVSQILEHLR